MTDYATARASRALVRERFEALMGAPVATGVRPNPRGDGWAVTVNLTDSPPRQTHLPDMVDGVPVVVEVIGRVDALSNPGKKRR